jgi:hypothetical protein
MANFLLLYHGGAQANSNEEAQAMMAAWGTWMEQVGENMVDMGNPTSSVKSVDSDGPSEFSGNNVSGYSIVRCESMDDALHCAQMTPIVSDGGSVDVYEIHPAM